MISNTNNINSVPEKKISGVIYGNPNGNAGYEPLLFMGNFGTPIPYERVGGFIKDFYSYKIDSTQTIYKYHSYNVNSVGATRDGILLIAISIPKGYKIDGGVSPYDVLNQLKNEFIRLYMTSKGLEVYEYKDKNLNKIIDKSIFDSVLNGFKLVPHKTPYHAMSSEGKEGVITLSSELQLAELFNDVQYSELKGYKEIFVSTGVVKNPKLIAIQGIEIPRKPNYEIIVDGSLRGTEKDVSKPYVFSANKDPKYFDSPQVSFTISDLLVNPAKYNNLVKIDMANEKIYVTTPTPIAKKVTIAIKIANQNAQSYFRSIRNKLYIKFNGKQSYSKKEITDQLTFTLIGEELSYLDTPNEISLSCTEINNYKIKTSTLSKGIKGYELHVEVEKVPQKTISKQLVSNKNMNQSTDDFALIQLRNQLEESNKKIKKLERKNNILLIIGIVACILVGFGTWGIPKIFGEEESTNNPIIHANTNQINKWQQLLNTCVKDAENAEKEIESAEANLRKSNIKEKEKKESLKTIETYKGILSNSESMAEAFNTLLKHIGDEEVEADALEKYNKIQQISAEVQAILDPESSSENTSQEEVDNDVPDDDNVGDGEVEPDGIPEVKKAAEKEEAIKKKVAEAAKEKAAKEKAAKEKAAKAAEEARTDESF